MRKTIGILFLSIGLFLLASVVYLNSQYSSVTRPFSANTLLASSWEKYKQQFLRPEGRIIDPSQQNITTSEGQSYALLRAVWIDDKPTFDTVWKWTKTTLQRPHDHLFGWKWGQRPDQSYGFLSNGGDNSAADADSDIALALILALRRWNDSSYQTDALPLLNDIWEIETSQAAGKRYLIAGNWAQNQQELIINPSYFAPYAWRIFAKVDHRHNWQSLVDPAYALLNRAGKDTLGSTRAVGLPPDWLSIDRQTGNLQAPKEVNLATNYSYDAMRVPWRVALDVQWNHDPQAKNYLRSSFGWLGQQYQQQGKLASSYGHDGSALNQAESPAMYAASLGYFLVVQPELAKKIQQDKVVKLYSNATNTFNKDLPYYDQNWLWFGDALYEQALVPFSQ